MTDDIAAIQKALAEPFEAFEVKFKPLTVSGNRALALAYIDARCIMDRLDQVLGCGNWKDEYDALPDGNVVCRLSLKINGEWVPKMDVGGESEQPDEGDRRKAAFSDSLKRAAVKWGMGRYLYRVPPDWHDYDPQKKRFVKTPTLPAGAGSRKSGTAPAAPEKPAPPPLPANGEELEKRLLAFEAALVKANLCKAGELIRHIDRQGVRANFPDQIRDWKDLALAKGFEWAKGFEADRKKARETTPASAPPSQPAATPPVQAPALSAPAPLSDREPGEPDPTEPVGKTEEREIQRLLRDADMLWAKARNWLNQNVPGSAFTSDSGILDLNHGQYAALRKALTAYVAEKVAKKPAGAKP